ncbi:MAG: hypothetical protein AB1439_08650 [candidate division FCPU426 bacterium]
MRQFLRLSMLILAFTQTAAAADLRLETDKAAYWRYELVTLTASLGQTESAQAVVLPKKLSATFWNGNQKIATVGNVEEVPLVSVGADQWRGYWPIPFNPRLGGYTAKVRVVDAEGMTVSASAGFKIQGRQPQELPKGFSVVTYEGGKKGPNDTPSPDPAEPDSWRNLIKWAELMGADAFWHCIGQTQVWAQVKPEQFPWSEYSVRLMSRVGEAAHAAGLKYGAWITSFVVIGDKIEDSGYTFTLGYNREQNALRQLRYVSLGCDLRIQHMIELLKKFEADPNVDYLGLDYMRTDFGGYEFATEFVRDMSIAAPPEWERWSDAERSLWMARLIEVERNPSARDQWQWWRAHKVGLIITHIREEVKPTKPMWVFSLGWKTGHQHGQDLFMMLDAGIGFNAPMFYSIDKPDYPFMLKSWADYLSNAPASVVVGECVDWNLLGRTTNPASPAEHLERQVLALEQLKPHAAHFGLFWHDLARAFWGARGPYGTWEWVMAGAASFSRLKADGGRLSYRLKLLPPVEIIKGRETELRVEVTNTGTSLNAVSLELVPLPRLTISETKPRMLTSPWPEDQRQTARLRFRTDQAYAANGNWQMVAVKAKSSQDAPRDEWFDFVYLPVTNELGPPLPGSTTATAASTPVSVKPNGKPNGKPKAKPGPRPRKK